MRKLFNTPNKKGFILFALIAILMFSFFIEPPIKNYIKTNWDKILKSKTENIESNIRDEISSLEIKLKSILSDVKDLNPSLANSFISLEFYDNNNRLVKWVNNKIHGDSLFEPLSRGLFNSSDKRIIYFSSYDSIFIDNNYYKIIASIPVEKKYQFKGIYYENNNLSEKLSREEGVNVSIDFSLNANLESDGRIYSFVYYNEANNPVCTFSFEKPFLDIELEFVSSFIETIRIAITFILLLFVFYGYRDLYFRENSEAKKLFYLFIILVILRIVLYVLEIPSIFIDSTITDPVNFSSKFGYGLASTPLELFLTLLFFTYFIYRVFKIVIENYLSPKYEVKIIRNYYSIIRISVIIISLLLILISLRGLGASVKSIIFDSSIRYFKDFSLIPNFPQLVMLINLLMLGFSIFFFSVSIITLSLRYIKREWNSNYFLWGYFITFQIIGGLYDFIQRDPQGNYFIRFIFISLSFLLSIFIINKKEVIKTTYLYIGFSASIITVSLLGYYNSLLEKESLKVTVQQYFDKDESITEFFVFKTIQDIKTNIFEKNDISNIEDFSPIAFNFWSKSFLYSENIPSSIYFYDSTGFYIGGFSIIPESKDTNRIMMKSITEEIYISKEISPFTTNQLITGITKVATKNKTTLFVQIEAYYQLSNLLNNPFPEFLKIKQNGILSAPDSKRLHVLEIADSTLESSIGDNIFGENDIRDITSSQFNEFNEAWSELKTNSKEFTFFVQKDKYHNHYIAAGLEIRDISLQLFDFFKVFLVHALLLSLIFIFTALVLNRNKISQLFTFKINLTIAFLIISIIPLLVMAIYFRSVTEEKNRELVIYKLSKRADQVFKYLDNYYNSSSANFTIINAKAKSDLGINFNIYKDSKLVYSANPNYYHSGVLPSNLNSTIYYELIGNRRNEILVNNMIENYNYRSYYVRYNLQGEELIFEVNDLFNAITVPYSDIEMDIFLFSSYSLAVILIIILSTFLARQISNPINKLVSATKGLAAGDFSVHVDYDRNNELKDLINGFNQMVKDLQDSQKKLSQYERETAWKEMARQVAHEIKNPLTPMKLSVQQLVVSYEEKSPKFDSIFNKVTTIILNQIEILKNIASEFSNFARMPLYQLDEIDLNKIINNAIDLFSESKISISFEENKLISVKADTQELTRIFVNLIRNSIESGATSISIKGSNTNELIEILIQDNGNGISKTISSKIFDENFSTKSSGMGLGLYMAKNYLKNLRGDIIIEETSINGTTFKITIPVN
ncbi:MAG: ATP-binding protein [Melioribacteraceae bacterium]|nr:ATP-binding protein [Melioribacteraceae bacterium]